MFGWEAVIDYHGYFGRARWKHYLPITSLKDTLPLENECFSSNTLLKTALVVGNSHG
jgi:hypothetical protein